MKMLLEKLRKSDRYLGDCCLCLQHIFKDQPWLLRVSGETRSAARNLTHKRIARTLIVEWWNGYPWVVATQLHDLECKSLASFPGHTPPTMGGVWPGNEASTSYTIHNNSALFHGVHDKYTITCHMHSNSTLFMGYMTSTCYMQKSFTWGCPDLATIRCWCSPTSTTTVTCRFMEYMTSTCHGCMVLDVCRLSYWSLSTL